MRCRWCKTSAVDSLGNAVHWGMKCTSMNFIYHTKANYNNSNKTLPWEAKLEPHKVSVATTLCIPETGLAAQLWVACGIVCLFLWCTCLQCWGHSHHSPTNVSLSQFWIKKKKTPSGVSSQQLFRAEEKKLWFLVVFGFVSSCGFSLSDNHCLPASPLLVLCIWH